MYLTQVHIKFKLNPETLYLTINLIDRYLFVCKIERKKFQLVAAAAMLIASKYEEIYAPEVRDFVYVTDKAYSKEEIMKMEYKILSTLNFDVLTVYPYTFLQRFHYATGCDKTSFFMAQYILEFSLLEYNMLEYSSSLRAAASLYIARKLLKIEPTWSKDLQLVTNFQERDLKACAKVLCNILELASKLTLKACEIKFSHSKFLEVAKIALFK